MAEIFKYDLGDKVEDMITGLQGIITSRTQWFNGCIRYGVEAQEVKDGRPVEGTSFDEAQLNLVKSLAVVSNNAAELKMTAKPPGGPRNDARSPAKDSMARARQ